MPLDAPVASVAAAHRRRSGGRFVLVIESPCCPLMRESLEGDGARGRAKKNIPLWSPVSLCDEVVSACAATTVSWLLPGPKTHGMLSGVANTSWARFTSIGCNNPDESNERWED